MTLRDITSIDECREVVDLQVSVWGRDSEVVPASVLFVSAKRGGILIGAYADGRLIGFVWSMPGKKDGRATHWSHMLGVSAAARRHGVGEALKWAQRERAIAQGVDLIEWTFDPLQAPNAHLNFSRLGAIATTYLVNAYGEMTGPLHRGTPTDRLVAEWWVTQREMTSGVVSPVPTRVISAHASGNWLRCGDVNTGCEADEVLVPVPARFTEMQQQSPDLALAWRQATREVFTSNFGRGYRAVGFFLDRDLGGGEYLLTQGANSSAGRR